MDDFDWVRDVSSDFMSFLKQYQSEGDIYKVWVEGISMEDQLTMMDKLYDHGFQWRGGHGRYDTSFVNIPILYLVTDTMEIEWDSGEDNRDTFEDREYERPKTQIPTDDFFNALGMSVSNINESNDLDWVKGVEDGYINVDVSEDYWGAWPDLSKPFIELGLQDLSGYIKSSDYDGTIGVDVTINNLTNVIMIIDILYDELIDRVKIRWNVYIYDKNRNRVLDRSSGNQLDTKDIFEPVKKSIKTLLVNTL